MAAPNLSIEVQPQKSGNVLFLPICPAKAGDRELAKIILRLDITKLSARNLDLESITFSFPGSDVAPQKMEGISKHLKGKTRMTDDEPTIVWSNGVDTDNEFDNRLYLRTPAPSRIRVSVRCVGFDEPKSETFDLVPFSRTFQFPFAAEDLRALEYFSGTAEHWANGGLAGTQIFAYDIGCYGGDLLAPVWSNLLPNTDAHHNENYRIFNKPIRAMASGTVISVVDTNDENVLVGSGFPPQDPGIHLASNTIAIQHGDEIVSYHHLRKGSVPDDIRKAVETATNRNDPTRLPTVNAGQMIGRAGNAGNSTGPHLHLECIDASTRTLRPIAFSRGWVVDLEPAFPPPNRDSPWVELNGRGISKRKVAIWPGRERPNPAL